MFLSEQTIKNHLNNINWKLGTHTMIGAYRRLGWIASPDDALDERMVPAQVTATLLVIDWLRSAADEMETTLSSLLGPVPGFSGEAPEEGVHDE